MPKPGALTGPLNTSGAGAVRRTEARTLNCGRSRPWRRQKSDDHAPAAQSTARVRTAPVSVTTVETAPASVSIPRAAQPWCSEAPSRRAASAMAGAALAGSARPSLGV